MVFPQPAAEHTFIFAVNERCLDDFLRCILADFGKHRCKVVIRFQPGFDLVVYAADLVCFRSIAVHDKIFQNTLFSNTAVSFFEQVVDQILLDGHRQFLSVQPQRIQFIEKHELAV